MVDHPGDWTKKAQQTFKGAELQDSWWEVWVYNSKREEVIQEIKHIADENEALVRAEDITDLTELPTDVVKHELTRTTIERFPV